MASPLFDLVSPPLVELLYFDWRGKTLESLFSTETNPLLPPRLTCRGHTQFLKKAPQPRYTPARQHFPSRSLMKKLALLFAVFALATTFAADKPNFLATHPRARVSSVTPTTQPALLHTGKLLAEEEKHQFLVSQANIAAAVRAATRPSRVKQSAQAATDDGKPQTITPGKMWVKDVIYTDLWEPEDVNPMDGLYLFDAGELHSITFVVTVKPNTAYLLAVKVRMTHGDPNPNDPNPQLSIYIPGWGPAAGHYQTVNGSYGVNEIAYSFTSSATGTFPVAIFSPNAQWSFISAELTSIPY
jgi:hypothetical protein